MQKENSVRRSRRYVLRVPGATPSPASHESMSAVEMSAVVLSEKSPLNRLLNRTLRRGLEAARGRGKRSVRHREKVHAMGEPQFNLDRALALAAALEDEQIFVKLAARK